MLFRIFYGNTFKDITGSELTRFTIGSGKNDTVAIPNSHLKKGHVVVSLIKNGWTMASKAPVFYGGKTVTTAALGLGTAMGISEAERISMFVINDPPERPTTIGIGDIEELILGSGQDCNITIKSRFVSRKHLSLKRDGENYYLTDNNSTNGTYVNGTRVSSCVLHPADTIVLGDLKLLFTGRALEIYYTADAIHIRGLNVKKRDVSQPVIYKRSPRLKANLPAKVIEIEPPPVIDGKPEINWLSTIVPALTTMGISIAIVALTLNFMMLVYTLPMTLIGVIMSIVNYQRGKKNYYKKDALRLEKYSAHLDSVIKDIQANQQEQLRALETSDPATGSCIMIAKDLDRRLWQRTPTDADFASVRIGSGPAPSSVKIQFPKNSLSLENDELQKRPQEIYDRYHMVSGVPVICNILQEQICGVVGPRDDAVRLISNMLVQMATQHSYTELKIVLICDERGSRTLGWAGKLPHVFDDDGQGRYLVSSKAEASELLKKFAEALKARKIEIGSENSYGKKPMMLPFYLFVFLEPSFLDKSNPINAYLFRSRDLCVGAIMAVESVSQLPPECNAIINVNKGSGELYNKNNTSAKQKFDVDPCGQSDLEAFGDALERVKCDEPAAKSSLPKDYSFYDLVGITSEEEWDVGRHWDGSDIINSMAAPIGVSASGDILSLDLHEKGHGPHGLVAGTTGSGKSEVLQSLILSIALRYHPHDVGFVMIDFKGGGMANQFSKLPHLIGTITNIAGKEIDRSLASIKAELLNRQRIFSECGVSNINDYIEKYHSKEVGIPIPHLIIIVDEFAELKAQQPDFMDELISAARIGRSLGVHLILATQKPSGQVNDQIWSNSKFRICLKVASAEDSNEMLKTPVAFSIKEPGRAYLQVGNNEVFELFQSGYSGVRVDKNRTQLDALVERLELHCAQNGIQKLLPICCEPLPEMIVCPEAASPAEFGEVMIGMLDDPASQYQGNTSVNISKNNTLIIGSAQMGKTNLIQSVIRQYARTYTPEEVNFYIIDMGAMTLRIFESLNHVGGVVTGMDQEKLKNLFKLLSGEIERRKQSFSKRGIGSFAAYQESSPGELARIVVFLDNLSVFKDVFDDEYEDMLVRFLREGVTYGISFVITNPQTSGLSYKYLSSIGLRIALYCNDSSEYGFLFDRCRIEPTEIPGRALLTVEKNIYEVQTFLAFEGATEAARSAAIREFVQRINSQNAGMRAKMIPTVPEHLDRSYFTLNYPDIQIRDELPFAIDYGTVNCMTMNCGSQFILALTGRNTAQKDQFVNALIADLGKNYFKRPVGLYIIDSFERKLGKYKDAAYLRQYSTSSDALGEVLEEVHDELSGRLEKLERESGASLEKEPWLVVVINNKRAIEAMADNDDAQDSFNEIYKKYAAMKVLFLLSDLDDASIRSSAPSMCRKIRDDKKLLYFGSLKEIKIVDVYGSSTRGLGELAAPDDAYLFVGEEIYRVKTVQEG